ncbi:MAG: UxaA family hydrolase, partial [Geminicoccaceae bacterium]
MDAVLLDDTDHVATVLHRIEAGETVLMAAPNGPVRITAIEPIPIFHKIAVKALPEGLDILKHGSSIGVLLADVDRGALVHVHNLRSRRALTRSVDG